MYHASYRKKASGVPVLSKDTIDSIGEHLIEDFCPDAMKYPQEIDIDLFIQDYLEVDQDYQYLSHCGIYLGMTVFNDTDKVIVYDPEINKAKYISAKANTIIIDNTLLADNQIHRYRFTGGHEAGHVYFHQDVFSYNSAQLTLDMVMENEDKAAIRCRIDSKYNNNQNRRFNWTENDWLEWQANAFSSAVLMPRKMVLRVCECYKKMNSDDYIDEKFMAYEISKIFNVSFEAAQYRINGLGITSKRNVITLDLFEDFFLSQRKLQSAVEY